LSALRLAGRPWEFCRDNPWAFCQERLAPWLLAAFLAQGPVHWLPGVPAGALRMLGWLLMLLAVGLVFAAALKAGRPPFPRGLLGPVGFIGLAVLWIPGLLQAPGIAEAADFVITLGSSAILFWCLYCIARQGDVVWAIFRRAALIIVVLAALAMANQFSGELLWPNLGRWQHKGGGVHFGGFGPRSSAWATGLVLFLPASALWLIAPTLKSLAMRRALSLGCCLVILVGQLASVGRNTFLAAALVLIALLRLRFSRWLGTVILMTLLLGVGSVCLTQDCGSSLQAGDLSVAAEAIAEGEPEDAVVAVGAADQFMTRRLVGYFLGFGEFAASPILGNGLETSVQINIFREPAQIHNLWLRWSVETGILAPLLLLLLLLRLLRAGSDVRRDELRPEAERHGTALLMLVVWSGLLLTLLEPTLLGVHAFAIWWAAAGALAGIADRPPAAANEPMPESSEAADPPLRAAF